MEKYVSATEGNRAFSKLLAEVQAGATIVITSHGQPVAKLCPMVEAALGWSPEKAAARERLLEHLHAQKLQIIAPWTREELYDRERHGSNK